MYLLPSSAASSSLDGSSRVDTCGQGHRRHMTMRIGMSRREGLRPPDKARQRPGTRLANLQLSLRAFSCLVQARQLGRVRPGAGRGFDAIALGQQLAHHLPAHVATATGHGDLYLLPIGAGHDGCRAGDVG